MLNLETKSSPYTRPSTSCFFIGVAGSRTLKRPSGELKTGHALEVGWGVGMINNSN